MEEKDFDRSFSNLEYNDYSYNSSGDNNNNDNYNDNNRNFWRRAADWIHLRSPT